MRIFNLTDVATPVLEQHKLVDQHFAIARRMVNPGEYVDIEDAPNVLRDLQSLLQVGAVSIDRVPPAYAMARQAQQVTSQSRLAGIPVRHVSLKETGIAGVVAQGQQEVPATEPLQRFDPTQQVEDVVGQPSASPVVEKSRQAKRKARK